jgi:signal transduction histidine kinase
MRHASAKRGFCDEFSRSQFAFPLSAYDALPSRWYVLWMTCSKALLLDSIVSNLVRNAIKYTPPSGRVLLACRRRGGNIGIDIYDTGMGSSADHLLRGFQQLESTKRSELLRQGKIAVGK